jgi:hypothetical protein
MKRQISQASMVVVLSAVALSWWLALGTQAQDQAEKKDEKPAPAAQPGAAQIEQMIAELKTIGELVKQLDSDKFEARQQASDKLVQLGAPVREPLRRVLANQPGLELAVRIETILQEVAKRENKAGVNRGKALRARLNQPITLENGIDPNTPLKDALDFLGDQAKVQFLIDNKAFEAIGIQKVEEQPVQLSKMKNVSLARVLRLLLGQIKGDVYSGAWLVRADGIEITTSYHAMVEVLGADFPSLYVEPPNQANQPVPAALRILEIVQADFERRPLIEALQELAEPAAINVVVDPRVGDKGKTPVTATFNNVCVDTAVELLADMAELKVVQLDRVFYLTTKENAKAFEAGRKPKRIELPGMGLRPPPM